MGGINTAHGDIARCLMAALTGQISNDTAVVLIFEDTDNTQSKYWWVLGRAFLADLEVLTEYTVLRHCQRFAEAIHSQEADVLEGHFRGAALWPAADNFFRHLAGGALVLLDESFPPLPVAAHLAGGEGLERVPRAVFLLGLREELSPEQLRRFEEAAAAGAWQMLRLSLGWVGEFTSKVVARLQVLHSRDLLLTLRRLCGQEAPNEAAWPCPLSRDRELFFKEGPLVHFVLPAHMRLEDLSCDPCSPAAGACSLVARACIAGLWRAHHAWDRCRLSFVFEDGVVTVTRRFKGRFQRKRQTEYHVLKELRQLMDRASPKATLKKACTVQLLSDDPVLPYRPEGTIELQLEASEAAEAWPLVPELLQALWQPPEGEDQPSCMVLLCCFTAPPWRNFDACRRFAAGLRGIDDHFGARG
ncbi:unnamed protein product [Effrenium voratum]|uniref:Uncharacterized protein n=1 Tax=Effrenium voratum TaxID=2562239 RepID=A0AA36N0R4_9DINO|nr:unnamed protein product [Effrenium voratum]